ncbi:MAG: hypothetical protein PSX80_15130, partial [bacterium]|nr:hypothetical protein [bacterium]
MTVLTRAFCGSGYSRLACILTTVVFLTLQMSAQASQVRSVGMDGHPSKETLAVEPAVVVVEANGIHGTPEPTQRLLIPQTETKQKPNLPVSVVSQAAKDSGEPPVAEEVAASSEPSASQKAFEPSWRPFDHIPRQSRFLKDVGNEADETRSADNGHSEKFHWTPAILQSVAIQGFQISYALVLQDKTRRALKGKYWEDYWESIKGVSGWNDGNKVFTNYVAHPMQGGMTGFIFVQNHDRAKRQKFGESRQYWKDRFKAFVWSAAWSTNWEIGPMISQSTIGNVGLYGKSGYVDLVITPTVGTGWLLT